MNGKIKAYLLLSGVGDEYVEKWASWLPYADANSEPARAMEYRASDALLAAEADPSSRKKAKALYEAQLSDFMHITKSKCDDAVADDFVGANYIGGTGNFDKLPALMDGMFDKAVADLRKK